MDTTIQNVLHYGTIKIDSLSIDCVVLDDAHHTRAYIQKQLMTALGVQCGCMRRYSLSQLLMRDVLPRFQDAINTRYP